MSQIENRTYDNIKQIFEEANIYIEAFFAGDKERTKDNLIIFNNDINKNLSFLANEKGETKMPGIILRKDGRYMIRKMVNGKRITFYTRSYKEALQYYKKLKKDNLLVELKKSKTSQKLSEWIDEWENTYKKNFVSSKTFNDIHNCLKKVYSELGNIQIKNLTATTIQNFLNKLPNNRTKERTELYLNALLQKATDIDLINKKANYNIKCNTFKT